MFLYKKFEKIALNNKKIAIFDIDKQEKITYEECLLKIKTFENKITELTNNYNKLIIINLPKGIDLILWQLTANKLNMPFINIEDDIRLNQIVNLYKNYILIKKEEIIIKEESKQLTEIENNNFKINNEKINYIIFTSGSTGKPKQIFLKDKGIVKVVLGQAKVIKMTKNKKFLWLLNSSFDASLSDIYITLLTGNELYVSNIKPNKIKTVINYINKYNITHTDLPPITLPLFLKYKEQMPSKLKIIIGGELANEETIKSYDDKIEFYNAYGPSETTICTQLSLIKNKKQKNDYVFNRISEYFSERYLKYNNLNIELCSLSNINKEIKYILLKNNQEDEDFYINDKDEVDVKRINLEQVYELGIAGYVALGYDNQQLNISKYRIINKEKVFLSGDLVKIIKKEEGLYYLSYVGRKDNQFKYHGKLICPEEIEKMAMNFGVDNAKVRFNQENEKIELYYQIDEEKLDENTFQKNLLNNIPEYMKPIHFYKKEKMEVSNNFKNI